MPRSLAVLALLVASSEAFFFGSSGGCGCAAAPACAPPPPPPVCAPPPAPSCPPPPSCGGSYPVPPPAPFAPIAPAPYSAPAPSYAPISQPANTQSLFVDRAPAAAYQSAPLPAPPAPAGGYAQSPAKRETIEQNFEEAIERTRVKRDSEQAFDPKCNSEELKNIIIKNIHENTAMAKRNIQTAAANEIGGRIDVICSKGTFSYIVNTELYCETAVDGTTCFAFRQSS